MLRLYGQGLDQVAERRRRVGDTMQEANAEEILRLVTDEFQPLTRMWQRADQQLWYYPWGERIPASYFHGDLDKLAERGLLIRESRKGKLTGNHEDHYRRAPGPVPVVNKQAKIHRAEVEYKDRSVKIVYENGNGKRFLHLTLGQILAITASG